MFNINTGPGHIAPALPFDKSEEAGASGSHSGIAGLVRSGGGPISTGFVTRAAHAAVADKAEAGKQPLLRAPVVAPYGNPALVNRLVEMRDDPVFSADPGIVLGWLARPDAMPLAASSNKFDVQNVNASGINILMAMLLLLNGMRQAEAEMNGSMGIKAAEATARTAESVMKDGMQKAIFGGVSASVGLVGAAAGAGIKLNSLHKSKLNTTHNLDAPALAGDNTATLNKALAGSSNSGNANGGESKLLGAHRSAFEETINKPNNVAQTAHAKASAANERGINRLDIYAEVATALGKGASGGVTAYGEYMSATEVAGQAISNLASTVATKASENARDRSKSFDSTITELLNMVVAMETSRNGAAGAIAERIRG